MFSATGLPIHRSFERLYNEYMPPQSKLSRWSEIQPSKKQFYLRRLAGPKIALMSFVGRFYSVRELYKKLTANEDAVDFYTKSANDSSATAFPMLSTPPIVSTVFDYGCWAGLRLPDAAVKALRLFADEHVCFADRQTHYNLFYAEKEAAERKHNTRFHMAQYATNDVESNEIISNLSKDAVLLAIAAQYFRNEPSFTGARLFWTFANNDEQYDIEKSSCYFHYDHDDFACLRFFFYITEVDEACGPHRYVRGSHKNKSTKLLLSRSHTIRSYEEISLEYGKDEVVTIVGPAGYGFAEDAHCFHQASRPLSRDRLVLQLTFAINDYKLNSLS